MKLGRLEVVGSDGTRVATFSKPVGSVLFNRGRSVAEVDTDYFLVQRILGPLPGGLTVRIIQQGAASAAPASPATPPSAPPPPSVSPPSPPALSFGQRMAAKRAAKKAARIASQKSADG